MPLDPNDPLIPMPWQMDDIRAYRASKAMQAEEDALKMEKLRLEVEQKLQERPESKISKAAELYQAMEQIKQKQEGIPFEDVAKQAALDKGMSLLEANKQQGLYNIEQAALRGKMAGIEAQLMGERGLAPTANVDIGGIKRTVLATQAGQAMGDAYDQTYQTMVPKLANTYMAEGHDSDTAYKMASVDARNNLLKERSRGNVTIMSSDMQTSYPIPYAKAEAMWRDPKTPPAQRVQLNKIFGEPEQSTAGNWIKTRLGK